MNAAGINTRGVRAPKPFEILLPDARYGTIRFDICLIEFWSFFGPVFIQYAYYSILDRKYILCAITC